LKKKQFNGTLGPTLKENYVKESARMDYNPELCKDYFETGHCAFGDTCIFIHDRTDYAGGHQLEKDWNDKQRKLHKRLMGKKYGDDSFSDSEEDAVSQKIDDIDDEGLPLKCKICSNFFREPIMTECGHYFCESCALKSYRNDKSCYSCQKPTHGIFHEAVKITQKLGKMSKEELEDYRKSYSYDAANESNHDDDCNKAESTT
jgi:RING finger protein 113A